MQEINFKHLNYLTDDFGIWQHTKGDEIDKIHGYALDDVARGLLVAVSYKDHKKIKIYTDFLEKAITKDRLVIFFDRERKPLPIKCSEDALGEAYWALSECYKAGFLVKKTERILKICEKYISKFTSIRGKSYAILGGVNYNQKLAKSFSYQLVSKIKENSSGDWFWPENCLTYGNAIIPLSLLAAAGKLDDKLLEETGRKALMFLNSQTEINNIPIAIGNSSWQKKNGLRSIYDQQPIDPAYQALANIKAYEMLKENYFLNKAFHYFSWFWGNNLIGKPLINLRNQSCFDSLTEKSICKNQGAENIVCYLFVQKVLWPYLLKEQKEKLP